MIKYLQRWIWNHCKVNQIYLYGWTDKTGYFSTRVERGLFRAGACEEEIQDALDSGAKYLIVYPVRGGPGRQTSVVLHELVHFYQRKMGMQNRWLKELMAHSIQWIVVHHRFEYNAFRFISEGVAASLQCSDS